MIPLRDANPTRRTAAVTIGIVIACVAAWAWELGLLASGGDASLDAFVTEWGVVPSELLAAWGAGQFLSAETATLITSQFLHGGWLHLLGNLLYLWIFANNVEDRLGRPVFLLFYLAGGVAAALAQVAVDPTSTIPTIGASGAIAATLGAYFVFFPGARITSLVFLGLLLPADRRPGRPRARVLVRPPAHRRADLARAWSRATPAASPSSPTSAGSWPGPSSHASSWPAASGSGRPPAPAGVG